jgi:hypothetical protein
MVGDNNESLIVETLYVRLGLDIVKPSGSPPLVTEARAIEDALRAICAAPEGTTIIYRGRAHRIVLPHHANPTKGTHLLSHPGSIIAAQIVFAPMDEEAQHICVEYRLIKNMMHSDGGPLHFLECEGNPTTVLTGNNVLPVAIAHPETGVIQGYPSSAPLVMRTVNRILFEFLEQVSEQVTGAAYGLFTPETSKAIAHGDFRIVWTQSCCYFPVENVPKFLQLVTVLFGQTIATSTGIIDLATHLGLNFFLYTDKRTHRVTGVMFHKRHGKKMFASLVLYDKEKRVAQMRQGKTLTTFEAGLIQKNVRFDITLHGPGIMAVIGEARRTLKSRRKQAPNFLESISAKAFLEGTPEQTAWWYERAVYVLSHQLDKGVMRRGSFAKWLVPMMIDGTLRLSSITKCTPEGLRELAQLVDRVVTAWHSVANFDPTGWAGQIAKMAGCNKSTVYERRKTLMAEFNIDIAIPYAFYRDLRYFGPASLTQPENRAALVAALDTGDGAETLRLLEEAASHFFDELPTVVGAAITSPPKLLPTKVAGLESPASGEASGVISSGNSTSRRLGLSRKSPVKPTKAPWSNSGPSDTATAPKTAPVPAAAAKELTIEERHRVARERIKAETIRRKKRNRQSARDRARLRR